MKIFSILTLFVLPAIALSQANKGGLKVFIENAEEDDLIGVIVQVINEDLVTAGTTDSSGFLYLPNIDEGDYSVLTMHVATKAGRDTFQLSIESGTVCTLRVRLELLPPLRDTLIFEQAPSSQVSHKGGLKIFIEKAEEDNIIAVTAIVMDGERNVAGGLTDFSGFLYLPNIDHGTYQLVFTSISIAASSVTVRIVANEILELRMKSSVQRGCLRMTGLRPSSEQYLKIDPLDSMASGLRVFVDNMRELELEDCRIKVYEGRKLVCKRFLDTTGVLDIANMAPGTYEIRLKHRNLRSLRKFTIVVDTERVSQLHVHFYQPPARHPLFLMSNIGWGYSSRWYAPYGSKNVYLSEDILRSPGIHRN